MGFVRDLAPILDGWGLNEQGLNGCLDFLHSHATHGLRSLYISYIGTS